VIRVWPIAGRRQATFRDNRRLSRRLTAAKLRQDATIENIDYRTAGASIARSFTLSPAANRYANITIWQSSARPVRENRGSRARSANKACRDGFSVLYKRASRLFADLPKPTVKDACRA